MMMMMSGEDDIEKKYSKLKLRLKMRYFVLFVSLKNRILSYFKNF
jgi:hypothetical protein